MALPEDYVGTEFNGIWVRESIGSGEEAEAYLCARASSGVPYVLRLDVNDDALWDDTPLIPPRNGAFERKGVGIVWSIASGGRPGERVGFPRFFRVIDGPDWVPLSEPYRNKKALAISEILSAKHTNSHLLEDFSVYQDWLHGTAAELAYGDLSNEAWNEWSCLVAARSSRPLLDELVSTMVEDSGRASDINRFLDGLSGQPFPPFTENRLLWVCILAADNRKDALAATLHCPLFRLNGVSAAEMMQFQSLYQLLDSSKYYISDTAELTKKWTALALTLVTEEEFADSDDWEQWESAPPVVEDD
jgi:hypothetical protein